MQRRHREPKLTAKSPNKCLSVAIANQVIAKESVHRQRQDASHRIGERSLGGGIAPLGTDHHRHQGLDEKILVVLKALLLLVGGQH